MKKVLLKVCGIVLVIASIFGLFACATGMKDVLGIKDYKTIDGQEAEEGVATARDGLALLKENEATYLEGVATYEAGVAALDEGKATLEAGRAAYAAGKKQIDDNTQAYNEGKETLSKIEPLMPLVNAYVEFRDKGFGKLQGFDSAQAWFAEKVRPLAANLGLELPDDVTDLPGYIQNMVKDGKAQLKVYEDGLAALSAAEAQLAAGEETLAAGEAQLAEGDAQLKVFEDGQAQIAGGMEQLLEGMEASISRSGIKRVPSLRELLGEDFTYWALDDKGEVKVIRGCKYVDLDQCLHLCDEAEHYLELSGADTTKEIACRLVSLALLGIASVLGIIAGITAIVGKKPGFGSGLSAAIILVVANIVGVISHYGDFCYMPREIVNGVKEYTYVGDLQMAALIATAIVAIVFAIVAGAAKKTMKASAAFDDDIKAENEELKNIISQLAEDGDK